MKKGDVYLADLNPVVGSEQKGVRPVLIFQNDLISKFSKTIITIPFTTNLRRAQLPTCVLVAEGEGGLLHDSVAICHQMRVLDRSRLKQHLGALPPATLQRIE